MKKNDEIAFDYYEEVKKNKKMLEGLSEEGIKEVKFDTEQLISRAEMQIKNPLIQPSFLVSYLALAISAMSTLMSNTTFYYEQIKKGVMFWGILFLIVSFTILLWLGENLRDNKLADLKKYKLKQQCILEEIEHRNSNIKNGSENFKQ